MIFDNTKILDLLTSKKYIEAIMAIDHEISALEFDMTNNPNADNSFDNLIFLYSLRRNINRNHLDDFDAYEDDSIRLNELFKIRRSNVSDNIMESPIENKINKYIFDRESYDSFVDPFERVFINIMIENFIVAHEMLVNFSGDLMNKHLSTYLLLKGIVLERWKTTHEEEEGLTYIYKSLALSNFSDIPAHYLHEAAQVLMDYKKYQETSLIIDCLIANQPNNFSFLILKVKFLLANEEYHDGLSILNNLDEKDDLSIPQTVTIHQLMSLIYMGLGKLNRALYLINSAISLDYKNAILYNDRLYINFLLGDTIGEKLDKNIILTLDPDLYNLLEN
jgi:hypothetical protein